MIPPPIDTTVIICAYTENRWDDLVAAVDALARQTLAPTEVILVVDHNDALAARAERQLVPHLDCLRVMESEGARGLSGARNTGVSKAMSPLLAFLDDDARPAATWLAELTAPLQDEAVWVVGGRATPDWPSKRPGWWPCEFDWVVGCSYRGLPTGICDVRNVMGCSMAFRREAFDTAGLFREGVGRIDTVPLGCEETELCIRICQLVPGVRIVYTPYAVVDHRVTEARTRMGYFLARCFAEGVSKAQISESVGARQATSTEWRYVRRVLPAAVLRGFGAGLRGQWTGIAEAGAVIGGLCVTVIGFLTRRIGRALWR